MTDRLIRPSEGSGAIDRAEQRGRVAVCLLYGGFGEDERIAGPIVSSQGFNGLDVELRRCGRGESCIIVRESGLNLSELHPDSRPFDERELVTRFRREKRIEVGKCRQQFPLSCEGFPREIGGADGPAGEDSDLRDLIEAGLPFSMLDMGGGETKTQVRITGSHRKFRIQIRHHVVVGTVTEGNPGSGSQTESHGDSEWKANSGMEKCGHVKESAKAADHEVKFPSQKDRCTNRHKRPLVARIPGSRQSRMNWKSLAALAAIPLAALGAQTLVPLDDAEPVPELASYMGELQRYTHKLALSADAGNFPLVEMYAHESLLQMQKIQAEVPEYEGQPIALLVDRIGLPGFEAIRKAVADQSSDPKVLVPAVEQLVQSCNTCHAAVQRGAIHITLGTDKNPFNQSFAP